MHREWLMTRCHACDNPIWSGPCTCEHWCKSYVCKQSFYGKLNDFITDVQASPVLTMDQWYEQTQLRNLRPEVQEPVALVPELRSSCGCQFCREVDHRMQ